MKYYELEVIENIGPLETLELIQEIQLSRTNITIKTN